MTKETTRKTQDAITVGSCDFYVKEFTGEIPEDPTEVCVAENHLGHSKGGCELSLSKETKTITDDFQRRSKTIKVTNELKVKLGLVGWNGDTLSRLESANDVEIIKDGTIRRTKLGGTSHDDGKRYLVVLHHPDATDGDCWWMFVGKNTAGLTFTYDPENETKIEPEFTGEPMEDGWLVYYYEEIAEADAAAGGDSQLAG